MNRREFLVGISAGILIVNPSSLLSSSRTISSQKTILSKVTPKEWLSVEALLDHLFPHEPRAPGAHDINAITFLQFALEDPTLDRAFRTFLVEGIKKLDHVALLSTGKHFFELPLETREKILRDLEKTPESKHWLREILELIIEALLGDPVYGGNTNGVGWKWLHHTPGFPQPTKDKRYFLL